MKILVVHNKYRSRYIGGEDIVYANEVISLEKHLGKNNVFSYDVSNDNIRKASLIYSIWYSREHYQAIYELVNNNNIDLVHIHNYFPLLTVSVFKAAKDAGAKIVHTLHNYRWWCISGIFYRNNYGICEDCLKKRRFYAGIKYKCYRGDLFQSILAQLAFWFYKQIGVLNIIDLFFALTDFQKGKLIHIGLDSKQIIVKPNAIAIRDKCQSEKKGYVFVGRLEESKGIEILLSVWSELGEDYRLTIIGSGALGEMLQNKFNMKNIVFASKKSRDETMRIISQSKYLIQPSLWYETFGLTIIEAMSVGVPVIGFKIGTRPDFIKDYVNGFLCDPSNLKKTIEMSHHYNNYGALSVNAINASKDYHEDAVMKRQIQIYRELIYE